MNQPLASMLRYNKWATATLLNACQSLSDEQLDSTPPGCSGSIRVLLMHLVGGQQTFVLRTMGRQHEGELSRSSGWPGFDELAAGAEQSSDDLSAIAERLGVDEDVDLPFAGKTYRFPKSFFLVHAVQHGMEHRTEIKVGLGALGIETPGLDGWDYAAAAGIGKEI
jgi:uncharacterized damage-inducible protein DinB